MHCNGYDPIGRIANCISIKGQPFGCLFCTQKMLIYLRDWWYNDHEVKYMISTKGRYAIRILLDLAEHNNGSYIPMKEVAARQEISLKYIEKIMPSLKSSGLIDSVHGIGGGYRLTRPPEQYTLWEILKLAEGDLAPVSCLQDNAPVCHRAAECRTLSVWQGYYDLTREYFSGITLADLMNAQRGGDYVI